jgi:polysaccharide export outer membrane protein
MSSSLSQLNVQNHLQSSSEYILGIGDVLEITFFRKPSPIQEEYRIHVNDKIRIDFPYYSELNVEVIVPPDGKIALKKVGKIKIVDLTTEELTGKLQEAYSHFLTQPELVVTLAQFYSPVQEFFNLLNQGQGQTKEVVVRSDGKISLPVIGELQAAKLTPLELSNHIQSMYSQQIPSLVISLGVKKEESKKILVLGEVSRSGVYALTSLSTPLEAISLAGGYNNFAYLKEILVIRRIEDNKSVSILVNVEEMLSKQNSSVRFHLQPYDIVFVPKKPVVKISVALKQIYDLIPPFVGLGFSYNLNPGREGSN